MNTAKHTPGPWTTEGADITNGYPEQGARVFIAEKVFSEHDATLIAAAPVMYEALEHAAMSCHHPACKCKGEYASQPERYCTCHVQKARQALAQAEGRQA